MLTSYLGRAVQMESMGTDYPAYAPGTGMRVNDFTDPVQLQAMQATLDTILRAEADFLLDVGAKFVNRVAG